MSQSDQDRKQKSIYVNTDSGLKAYPEKPSTWESVKEVFEPTHTRAQLDAIRSRRTKYGS